MAIRKFGLFPRTPSTSHEFWDRWPDVAIVWGHACRLSRHKTAAPGHDAPRGWVRSNSRIRLQSRMDESAFRGAHIAMMKHHIQWMKRSILTTGISMALGVASASAQSAVAAYGPNNPFYAPSTLPLGAALRQDQGQRLPARHRRGHGDADQRGGGHRQQLHAAHL